KEIVQMDDANKNSKVMQVDNDIEDEDHEENEEIMQEVENHEKSEEIMQIDNVNKNSKVAQVDNGSNVEGEGHKVGDNEEDDEDSKESNEGSDEDKKEELRQKFLKGFQPTKKKKILTGNKLKVSKQCHELLAFESELTVIAPFYDKNSFIKKDDYYKSLLNYLKELSILRKTSIVQFDPAQINGGLALEYENLVLSNSDDNLNLQDQIMLLRHTPQLSQDLK
ncbi:15077_t:CDS:2, partial [Cetraspora pellucida]